MTVPAKTKECRAWMEHVDKKKEKASQETEGAQESKMEQEPGQEAGTAQKARASQGRDEGQGALDEELEGEVARFEEGETFLVADFPEIRAVLERLDTGLERNSSLLEFGFTLALPVLVCLALAYGWLDGLLGVSLAEVVKNGWFYGIFALVLCAYLIGAVDLFGLDRRREAFLLEAKKQLVKQMNQHGLTSQRLAQLPVREEFGYVAGVFERLLPSGFYLAHPKAYEALLEIDQRIREIERPSPEWLKVLIAFAACLGLSHGFLEFLFEDAAAWRSAWGYLGLFFGIYLILLVADFLHFAFFDMRGHKALETHHRTIELLLREIGIPREDLAEILQEDSFFSSMALLEYLRQELS